MYMYIYDIYSGLCTEKKELLLRRIIESKVTRIIVVLTYKCIHMYVYGIYAHIELIIHN